MANTNYTRQIHNDYLLVLDKLKVEFEYKLNSTKNQKGSPVDFDIIDAIGSGAFGKVFLVRNKNSLTYHAMKAVEKSMVVERNYVKHIILERKLLQSFKFPFVITLDEYFKDNVYLYFIFPVVACGELYENMQKSGKLSDALSKFYAAQVTLALEYLHHCNVIHRDIKPENILIEETGYIKLCDFGISKVVEKKTYTLCGTPEYLAPEVILSRGYSFPVDWWALGVLIYEMLVGYPPFYDSKPDRIYEKILEGHYKCPRSINKECRKIIKDLLHLNPQQRIGSLKNGTYDVKSQEWFRDICWNSLLQQNLQPPYIPKPKDWDTDPMSSTSLHILKRHSSCLHETVFKDF